MKNTVLFFALAFGTICMTSCSRGYGCPYTMESKTHQKQIEKKNDIETAQEDLICFNEEMIGE